MAPRLLVSTVVTAVGFQGSCRVGSGGLERDLLKHHRAHCLYQDSAKFLKNKCSLDLCKPFVNFQTFENVDSDNFCQFLFAFVGKFLEVLTHHFH